MKKYTISVIIPVYNGEKNIDRAICSIINQEKLPLEVIIINDGSTDRTKKICSEFEKKYSFINLVNLKCNKGVSYARNIGIKIAKGQYIHFMDSDDTISKNTYSKIYEYIKKYQVDLVSTGSNFVQENVDNIIEIRKINTLMLCNNQTEIADYLKTFSLNDKERVLNVIWNKIYSAKVIKDNQIMFDITVNLGEDFLFNCAYLKCCKNFLETPDCLYNYFKNQNDNLSSRFRTDILQRRKKMYDSWIELYKYFGIYNLEIKNSIDKYEGRLMYYSLYTLFSDNCNLCENEKKNFLRILIQDNHSKLINCYLRLGLEKKLLNSGNVKLLYMYMKLKIELKLFIKKGLKFTKK